MWSCRKKGPVLTEEEQILQRKRDKQQVVQDERSRVAEHRRKNRAALVIQRTWRTCVTSLIFACLE